MHVLSLRSQAKERRCIRHRVCQQVHAAARQFVPAIARTTTIQCHIVRPVLMLYESSLSVCTYHGHNQNDIEWLHIKTFRAWTKSSWQLYNTNQLMASPRRFPATDLVLLKLLDKSCCLLWNTLVFSIIISVMCYRVIQFSS